MNVAVAWGAGATVTDAPPPDGAAGLDVHELKASVAATASALILTVVVRRRMKVPPDEVCLGARYKFPCVVTIWSRLSRTAPPPAHAPASGEMC